MALNYLKEELIRKLAVETALPIDTINAIIVHQFDSAVAATKLPGINSIELSGFGKIMFNKKKALKCMEKYVAQTERLTNIINNPSSPPQEIHRAELTLRSVTKNMEALKIKL